MKLNALSKVAVCSLTLFRPVIGNYKAIQSSLIPPVSRWPQLQLLLRERAFGQAHKHKYTAAKTVGRVGLGVDFNLQYRMSKKFADLAVRDADFSNFAGK